MVNIKIKRVYETPESEDGFRVLVDRVWPRGMNKEKAAIDLWAKDVAPTTKLRKWFGHDPEKWGDFKVKYVDELRENAETVRELLQSSNGKIITLLYGAKDEQHNQAIVLRDFIVLISLNRITY
ncbi:DUF488 domain-containing protein [Brucella sp. 21LCYQ03]|nr:DUF488 domain-containing protein [Brucella sp. 21LCYQ03]